MEPDNIYRQNVLAFLERNPDAFAFMFRMIQPISDFLDMMPDANDHTSVTYRLRQEAAKLLKIHDLTPITTPPQAKDTPCSS